MDILAYGMGAARSILKPILRPNPSKQDVDIYFDEAFAQTLEDWAVDNAWREIQVLLGDRTGRVLDLACGTGRAHDFISRFSGLTYFGCDISDTLIKRAIARGLSADRVSVQDAVKMSYPDKSFEFIFSIGSLEHFTIDGLVATIAECKRLTTGLNFHQVPVSKSGLNEGWISPQQSYWNNSEKWWLNHFRAQFGKNVWTMNSDWQDRMSRGVWFITAAESWMK
jgi:SAM-dependent methyltransferase